MRSPLSAVTVLSALVGLAGCEATSGARSYTAQANATFAESDVRSQILRPHRSKYAYALTPLIEARLRGQKTTTARFLGTANYGRPGPPFEKQWVIIVIDAAGNVASTECLPDGERPITPSCENLIKATTPQWRFTPATVDGQPVSSLNLFPAYTDGNKFYVAAAQELQK